MDKYGCTPIPSGRENMVLETHRATDVGSAPKGSGKAKR